MLYQMNQNEASIQQLINNAFTKNITEVHILRFLIQDVGTYVPQVVRPYKTVATEEAVEQLVNTAQHNISNLGKLLPESITGMANSIIQIDQLHQGIVNIPNGWNERRLRFMLEVMCVYNTGTKIKTYINGFSSHRGVSLSNHLDPNMIFYINNYITTSVYPHQTPYGIEDREMVIDSAQIINGVMYKDQINSNGFYTLRPVDIMIGMDTQNISEHVRSIVGYDSYHDSRLEGGSKTYIKNDRVNTIPSLYVSSIINNYHNAVKVNDSFGQDPSEITSRAVGMLMQNDLDDTPFLKILAKVQGVIDTTFFTINDLYKIAPYIDNVTEYIKFSDVLTQTYNPSTQSERMDGAIIETTMATMIAQSLPTIMSRFFIYGIHFTATNKIIGVHEVPLITILNCLSFIKIDLVPLMEPFKSRVAREILDYLSYGNQIPYEITVNCNMFGDTTIDITVNTTSPIRYIVPSFCDNLFTPITTLNQNNLTTMASDFRNIVDRVEFSSLNYGSYF